MNVIDVDMKLDVKQDEGWTGFEFLKVSGRINRVKYCGLIGFWWLIGALSMSLASGPALLKLHVIQLSEFSGIIKLVLTILITILFIVGFIGIIFALLNCIMLSIRRLHDFDLSGWWLILAFIPVVGGLWWLVILTDRGTETKNKYGERTKNASKHYKIMMFMAPIMWLIGGYGIIIFGAMWLAAI